jgi:hypothetical protein
LVASKLQRPSPPSPRAGVSSEAGGQRPFTAGTSPHSIESCRHQGPHLGRCASSRRESRSDNREPRS